jgi:hypothetical protein
MIAKRIRIRQKPVVAHDRATVDPVKCRDLERSRQVRSQAFFFLATGLYLGFGEWLGRRGVKCLGAQYEGVYL